MAAFVLNLEESLGLDEEKKSYLNVEPLCLCCLLNRYLLGSYAVSNFEGALFHPGCSRSSLSFPGLIHKFSLVAECFQGM